MCDDVAQTLAHPRALVTPPLRKWLPSAGRHGRQPVAHLCECVCVTVCALRLPFPYINSRLCMPAYIAACSHAYFGSETIRACNRSSRCVGFRV